MRKPGNHQDREVFSNLTLYNLQSKDLGVLDTIPKPLQAEADPRSADFAGSRLGMGLCLPPMGGCSMAATPRRRRRMGNTGSQVSRLYNMDGVMEYCTYPPRILLPVFPASRDLRLHCRDITKGL